MMVIMMTFRKRGFGPWMMRQDTDDRNAADRSNLSDGRNLAGEHSESALDILKKRYARGEISKMDFDEMKRNLS
jgi:uncharacterized membrane protein